MQKILASVFMLISFSNVSLADESSLDNAIDEFAKKTIEFNPAAEVKNLGVAGKINNFIFEQKKKWISELPSDTNTNNSNDESLDNDKH